MDRIAMRAGFRAEVADQASVAKIGLLEKVELDIKPLAKTVERLERVVPQGFRDVLLHHRKISDQEFETECFFGLEVVGEGPLRHARCANDVADRRAAISLFKHDAKALREYFFAKRWSRHRKLPKLHLPAGLLNGQHATTGVRNQIIHVSLFDVKGHGRPFVIGHARWPRVRSSAASRRISRRGLHLTSNTYVRII